jgi:hypothetical protein
MIMPGIASLEDGQVSRKLDIKNAKGMDGATITHNGYEPGRLTFKLVMCRPIEWELYQQVLPLIAPKLGKPPSAPLRCEHPAAAAYGIDQVIVEKVTVPKKGSVFGTKEVTISLVQWLPQPKKAKGMKKGGPIDLPPTTKDIVESQLPYRPGTKPSFAAHPGQFVYASQGGAPAPLPSEYNAVPNPT